ncbi:caffeic acid 3-O-methyltransferase-like protein [Trifolium pratense]|uniref:Caffeic acid 3-O-methyltransferase-like protein n=1 Tax=Trifolium pratense TaxID=57577 RepID=A0A2K3LCI4_TRIPR|nr:caffeic acid 3-O-methyltransferase-like protein [Trifolium pratense]
MEKEEAKQVTDEESFLFAMELAGASSVPMVLKSALDLGIIEIIAKAGPNAYLSSSQIASQIRTFHKKQRCTFNVGSFVTSLG